MAELVSKQKSKKWLVFVIVGILLVAGLVLGGLFVPQAARSAQYNKEIDAAEKYYLSCDYEAAAAHYIAAISINPKTFAAYEGVYHTYIAAADLAISEGNIEKAVEYYQTAIDVISAGYEYVDEDKVDDIDLMLADLESKINNVDSDGIWKEISFGTYNGKPVKWIILDEDPDSMLIMSKYCFVMPSETVTEEYCVWGDSRLREYLNDTFIYEVFDESEQNRILISVIDNEVVTHVAGETESQGTVEDKVYVLSVSEFMEYFPGEDRIINGYCASSSLAIAYDINTVDDLENSGILFDKSPDSFEIQMYGAEYFKNVDYWGVSWILRDVSPDGTEGLVSSSQWYIDGSGSTHPYILGCCEEFRPVVRITK